MTVTRPLPPLPSRTTICRYSNCSTFLIQEQDRRQRLVLRRLRDLAVDRQVGQERLDFGGTHVRRVPFPAEQDESTNPGQILLFRTVTVVKGAQALVHVLEQAGLRVHAAYHLARQLTGRTIGGLFESDTCGQCERVMRCICGNSPTAKTAGQRQNSCRPNYCWAASLRG